MNKRIKPAGWTGFFAFYLVVGFLFVLLAGLGGCTRHQAVIVQPNIEPARAELLRESKLPAPETAEPDDLKRCIKNLATTRTKCGQNADRHNALIAYEKKVVTQRRVE